MIRQTKQGFWIIDGDTHIGRWSEESGRLDHDQNVLPIILKHIPKGGTVVDAGAYIGDHTCAYLDRVGPTGTVFAFEPNPEAAMCLRRNCPDARVYDYALSDSVGTVCMELAADNFGSSRTTSETSKTRVLKAPLDMFLMERLDFIKLDVEGDEPMALGGAEKLIRQFGPVMMIEVNRGALERNGHTPESLMGIIMAMNYSVKNVFSWEPMRGDQFDVLCTPIK